MLFTCFFNSINKKKHVLLTCLNDTCHSYMWVVWNFLRPICRKFLSKKCKVHNIHMSILIRPKKKKKSTNYEMMPRSGLVCPWTIHYSTVHVLFFLIFLYFLLLINIKTFSLFSLFYITSIIFYYYSNKKIHYNTKLFHFLYHIITFY
jgi:hypothetical protein